jgi:hypothetical protein
MATALQNCWTHAVLQQTQPFLAADLDRRSQYAEHRMKEGTGRRQLSLPPHPFLPVPSIPSSKLQVSDPLQDSSSNISAAKNACAGYTKVSHKYSWTAARRETVVVAVPSTVHYFTNYKIKMYYLR